MNRRYLVLFVYAWSCFGCLGLPAQENGTSSALKAAIVKIYVVQQQADYYNPWRMLNMANTSGSGCVISENRILTNAHVVADSKFLQVRRHGQSKRYKARVLWVSHEADLALLTTLDGDFFEGVQPLVTGPLPQVLDDVTVYGFPLGGDALSITKGILSRIEHQYYVHSSCSFLAGQIDAAINPGNSGGPVIADGRIVGVVMQTHNPGSAENIGYMVPTPILEHFLADVGDGSYDGFPDLAVYTQPMENPALKAKYGMASDQTGVMVRHVAVASVAEGILSAGDILLGVAGHDIADDGSIEFRSGERTQFSYYADIRQIRDTLDFGLLRQGRQINASIKLSSTGAESFLVPAEQYDRRPRYFIFGGMVISQLTKNVLMRWGPNWENTAPEELVAELNNWPDVDRREVVVILQVLPADVNIGYHNIGSRVLHRINGKTFRGLADAYRMFRDAEDEFIVLELGRDVKLVLDRKQALETHAGILVQYNIKEDCSADLRKLGD